VIVASVEGDPPVARNQQAPPSSPVAIQPVARIDDARWVWHIGFDAEASGFLNVLGEGAVINEAWHAHLLALFRLEFRDPADLPERVRGSRETRMLPRASKRRMGGS
jgi:hypothetical protein